MGDRIDGVDEEGDGLNNGDGLGLLVGLAWMPLVVMLMATTMTMMMMMVD